MIDTVVPLTWLISAFAAIVLNLVAGLLLGARLMFRQESMGEELKQIARTLHALAQFETKLAVMEERLSSVQHEMRRHLLGEPPQK
jgi:hypothetical protein